MMYNKETEIKIILFLFKLRKRFIMDMYDIAVTQSARGALYDFFDVDIADVDDWTPRIEKYLRIQAKTNI